MNMIQIITNEERVKTRLLSEPARWDTTIADHEYHAITGMVSSHWLLEFEKSPYRFHRKFTGQIKFDTEKDCYRIGSALHAKVLEPHREIKIIPGVDGRTVEGKKIKAEFTANLKPTEIALPLKEYELVNRMFDELQSHPLANELLFSDVKGQNEITGFSTIGIDGLAAKCRIDRLLRGAIVDLKTAGDSSHIGFGYSADRFGYLFQGAFYQYMAKQIDRIQRDVFTVAVENCDDDLPEIGVYQITQPILDKQLERLEVMLDRLSRCWTSNHWPRQCVQIKEINVSNNYFDKKWRS